MNFRNLTLSLLGAAAMIGSCFTGASAARPSAPAPKKHAAASTRHEAAVVVPAKTAYAWVTRDRGGLDKGLVSFSLNKPGELKSLHALPELAYAGCYADGKYYFDRYRTYTENGESTWAHIAFSSVDIATGAITDIKDWSDEYFVINDMTYDYANNIIYAMGRNIYQDDFLSGFAFEYSSLMTINPVTGVVTEAKQFIDWGSGTYANKTYYNIACDLNGTLYSVDQNGMLVTFDPANDFAETVIGRTGMNPGRTTQSMEFDHTTGTLYWACDNATKAAELVIVDTTSGHASVVGETGNDSHLIGLHIPFAVPSQAAPAAVSALKAVPDADGGKSITLSWVNPSKTYGGHTLNSIASVKILRNNETVKTITDATVGTAETWTDNVADAALYSYTVVATNVAGDGLPSGVTRWVGKDIPMAVTQLGVARDGAGAQLRWTEPEEGIHGGVIDRASLGYKIVRFPDGEILATDARGTSFDDKTVPGMGRYYYTVESHTAEGVGEAATSVEIALGDGVQDFPWSTLFSDRSEFDLWTVVDRNGGSTWSWKSRSAGGYEAQAMYQYDNNNVGDDYLVSPDLLLQAGTTYKVRFAYAGSNEHHTEKLELTFGRGKTAEAQSAILKRLTMTDGTFRFCEAELPAIEETGNYNIAFHAISDPGNFNIYVTDVTVSVGSAGGSTIIPDEPGTEDFEAPYNLKATVDAAANEVLLTWNTEETGDAYRTNIYEDFENMRSWEINPAGDYGWSYIDGDGGRPYLDDYEVMPYPTDGEPLAAMVMTPNELHKYIYEPNPAHSGENYLLFKSNYSKGDGTRPAPAPDDWFISPALDYGSEFIFRFYCKADPDAESPYGDRWNTEQFLVGYSKTDRKPGSFVWMTENNEKVTTNFNEWVKKEYSMPANARYVCIRYCTPDCGYWFMVDDVFIGIESGARAPRAAEFKGFEISLDNKVVDTTPETNYMLTDLTPGVHVAKVTAVYEGGRSKAAVTSFTIGSSGISETAPAGISVYPNPASETVFFGTTAVRAALHSMSGVTVAETADAASMDISGVAAGIYLLTVETETGSATTRLIVK